jgi:hypothetical protein
MKTKYILKGLFTFIILITVVSCDYGTYDEDVIEELNVTREFAPIGLEKFVRNQTVVELNWAADENAKNYVVEFSADDTTFSTIFKTIEVTADQLPVQVKLEGETVYSIRVKAISSRGLEDSKWALEEATTLTEQLMTASIAGDIQATQATLRWEAGNEVTHFLIQPGDIRHDITAQEKTDGIVTITGLIGETEYIATLYKNTKVRGSADFITGIDVGNNTLVLPTDDLFQMIADAAPGDILLLEQGDYTAQTGIITLDKSITIQGLRVDYKPQLKVGFSLVSGATDVSLIDLDLMGDVPTEIIDVVSFSAIGNYNSLLISGCNIHDFNRSFVRGNTTDGIVQTVTIENSVVTNVLTSGGDFIDFRNSDVLNLNVKTSTFNNCAPRRDFIRLDDAGTSTKTGLTCNVLLENCTLYGVSDSSSKRVFYVRFQSNKITSKNNLITDTSSEGYSDQSRTDPNPTFNNNNYFNAPGFFNASQKVYDGSGTHLELDPGFTDVASGDFTITNQTLIDKTIGDPRWRP